MVGNPYLTGLWKGDVITRPASRRPEYTVSAFTLTALGPKEAEMSSRHPVGVVI